MYLALRIFLQAFILENQVFIRYNMFDLSSPWGVRNGLQFFENLLMSYNYVIAIIDRLALFKIYLFLIIK